MVQILIGVLSGIFSGIGMGGGTILIFLLVALLGVEQHIAQATNLIYFIPTAISAIIINYKEKNIDTKLAVNISIFGIIGAIIGALISVNIDVKILKKLFGIFLVIITIHEIYTFFKEYKQNRKRNKTANSFRKDKKINRKLIKTNFSKWKCLNGV